MTTFKTRLAKSSKVRGCVVLANDYGTSVKNLEKKTIKNIEQLHPFLCGIKLNFHLLLSLGGESILGINKAAHKHGMQTIADIKLNDIRNTNLVTVENLWSLGFDAVIANPIMGLDSLKDLVRSAHRNEKGVIAMCHMSAPEARLSYDMEVNAGKRQKLYQLFLDWAVTSRADGIIVGATFPRIVRYCSNKAGKKLDIFSPGVGTQGGSVAGAISAGTDYLIVGRTILNAKNPAGVAEDLQLHSLAK